MEGTLFSSPRLRNLARSLANHFTRSSVDLVTHHQQRAWQNPPESGSGTRFDIGVGNGRKPVENIFEKKQKKVLHGKGVLVISFSRYGEPSGARGREARKKTEKQLTVPVEAVYCVTT